jgi:hypothetical protein
MNRIYRRDLKAPIDRFHGIDRLETLARIIFCSVVMVSSNAPRRGDPHRQPWKIMSVARRRLGQS